MLNLYRRTAQTAELVKYIQQAMEGSPTWVYGDQLSLKALSPEAALKIYLDSFWKLAAMHDVSDDAKVMNTTRERFKFIEADVTSRLVDAELRASSHHMNWQWLLRDTLLVSRSQAIAEADVTKHMTKADIIRLPLVDRVSIPSVARFLRDEIERGNMVSGHVDGRQRWFAPSVSSCIEWWLHKLAWFAIRMSILGRDKPAFQKLYRSYWCNDISMPEAIWDWTQEQDWTVTTRPIYEPGTRRHGGQAGLPFKVVRGGRDAD